MNRVELKSRANQMLENRNFDCFWPLLITFILSSILDGLSYFIYITWVFSYLVMYLYRVWLINFVRTGQTSLNYFFNPLKNIDKDIKVFVTMFLMSLFVGLWSILLIVPGIIMYYAYSMTPYLLADEDCDKEYLECIRLSKDMMQGHKKEFFILQLSFIGWHIICILTLGILYIWKGPYIETTYALYYEEIKKEYVASHPGVFKNTEIKDENIIDVQGEIIDNPFEE